MPSEADAAADPHELAFRLVTALLDGRDDDLADLASSGLRHDAEALVLALAQVAAERCLRNA